MFNLDWIKMMSFPTNDSEGVLIDTRTGYNTLAVPLRLFLLAMMAR